MHIRVSTKYRKPQIENEQLDAGRKILICFDDFPNETSIDRVFPATFDHYKSPLVYPMIFPFHHDCHWNPNDPMEITWEISWFTSFLQRWNRKSPVFSNGFSREKKHRWIPRCGARAWSSAPMATSRKNEAPAWQCLGGFWSLKKMGLFTGKIWRSCR